MCKMQQILTNLKLGRSPRTYLIFTSECNVTSHVDAYASGYVFSMCQTGNTCFDLLFVFIDAFQTACEVMCLLFVKSDEFDVPDTENMHCAKLPDAQDDRICSYFFFFCYMDPSTYRSTTQSS